MNIGVITTSVHAGTHADAPVHVESSWGDSGSLPPSAFIGDVCVLAVPSGVGASDEISIDVLKAMIVSAMSTPDARAEHAMAMERRTKAVPARLLVCTGCSVASGVFPDAWPVLTESAAAWLVARGVVLWGTDAPSVDARTSKSLPIHHALFDGGAFVLENLSLTDVTPGLYELLAQPVAIMGADAAPVRALLRARLAGPQQG